VCRRNAEERRQQGAQLGEALKDAVVPRIRLVEGQEVVWPGQAEEAIRQVELFARRFAAGEIELQPALLEVIVAALDLIVERGQVFGRERFESGHASGDHSAAGASSCPAWTACVPSAFSLEWSGHDSRPGPVRPTR